MKRFVVVACVAGLVTSMVAFEGTALAGRVRTHLTLQIADDSVGVNQTIVLTGDLHSNRRACYASKSVKLFIDGGLYGSTVTNENGGYRFEVSGPHPRGEHMFQTKRKKTRRCRGSSSNVVRAQVGG
ncbi:MAG: hypothetical protein ACRDKT_14000 [Actinomycetota bacterium]